MGPALLGVSVSQISLLINTIFASFLKSGSVSWLYYADRLMEFPSGMLGVALGTILLPVLSGHAAKGDHDESVAKDVLFDRGIVTPEVFERLERAALELFAFGQAEAALRGLILVDTKYELGVAPDGRVVLIDEIHTPDSSRYWYADGYDAALAAGEDPRALDKEFVRRWLVARGFSGEGPPPPLTPEIRSEAAQRYVELASVLLGRPFVPDAESPLPRLRRNLGLL